MNFKSMKMKKIMTIAFFISCLIFTVHSCKKNEVKVNAPKIDSVKLKKDSLKRQHHEMQPDIEDTLTMPSQHL